MLQTASGDDPKIAQNSSTTKIASRRPRIAPRRLQDGQDAQTDPNTTPKTTPNKSPNRRNIKVNCDMMIVQKTLKFKCKTHILDIQNIALSSLSALESIKSQVCRSVASGPLPRTDLGPSWALLEPLGPIYNRNMAHLGPQERPNIGLRRSQMPSWGRLGSVLVPFGASWAPSCVHVGE